MLKGARVGRRQTKHACEHTCPRPQNRNLTTKPTHTANPPVDQSKRVDLGAEVNFPGEDIHDAIHQNNIGRNNTMIANNNPAYKTNIDVIQHPQRKMAQEQTPTWNIGTQGNPKD